MAEEVSSHVTVTGDTTRAQQAVGGLGSSFGGLFASITGGVASGNLLSNAITSVIGAFKGAVGGAFEMNASLQTTTLQFATLMKDADAAEAHVQSLFEFAKKTPFETGPIIEASKHLQVFGGNALNTQENITRLGNASAATNAPINELGFWVGRLYSQLQAGKPFGESAMRLQELAVMTPQVRQAMENLQKSGGSAAEVFQLFQKDLENFDGAMIKQAGTWQGLTSTITDSVNMMLADVFKPFFTVASEGLNELVQVMGSEGFEAAVKSAADTAETSLRAVLDWIQTDGKSAAVEMWELVKVLGELGKLTFDTTVEGAKGVRAELAEIFKLLPDWLEMEIEAGSDLAGHLRSTRKELEFITGVFKTLLNFRERLNREIQLASLPSVIDIVTGNFEEFSTMAEQASGKLTTLADRTNQVKSADEALALVMKGKLHDGIGVVIGDSIAATEAAKPLTKAQQEVKKALDDIAAASKPLTDIQKTQIDQWDRLGVSAGKMATALGVADEAITQYLKQKEAQDKFTASITIFQQKVLNTIPTLKTYKQEINGVLQIGDDYSRTLISNQIETDAFGHAIKVNLVPTLGEAAKGVKNIVKEMSTFEEFLSKDLGGLITSAFAGGGNVAKTIASGLGTALFKSDGPLTKTLSAGVTDVFGKTGMMGKIGDVITSAIPGVGALIGPAITGLFKLFGPSEESRLVNKPREMFIAAAGGLEVLNPKIQEATGSLQLMQNLFNAKTEAQYKAAVQEINTALGEFAAKQEAARAATEAFGVANQTVIDKLNGLKAVTPDLQAAIDAALATDSPDAFAAALTNINGIIDTQATKQKELDAVLKEYGISWTKTGTAAKEAKVAETADEITRKFKILNEAGVSTVDIMKGMGKPVNDFVKEARQAGVQIPESFQPIVQAAIDQGKLFDDNGKKITDITGAGITFGKNTVDALADVGTQVGKLSEVLERMISVFGDMSQQAISAGTNISKSMRTARTEIDKTHDAVDGLNFGSSPGGLKEIPLLADKAANAFKSLRRQSTSELGAIKGLVDSMSVGQMGFGNSTITAVPAAGATFGAVSGARSVTIELVNKMNDREMSRELIPVMPSVLKELGLA